MYKYLGFGSWDGCIYKENIYWKNALRGVFHLSRAEAFEDKNDCEPHIDKHKFLNYFKHICNGFKMRFSEDEIAGLENCFFKKMEKELKNNFQKMVRIGCFTNSSAYEEMWEKYSVNSTGFCLEYIPSCNYLMKNLINKVIYIDDMYDVSMSIAIKIFFDLNNIEMEKKYLQIFQKNTYTCLYIKKNKWMFENEYRLILPDNITVNGENIKAKDYLIDDYDNISLKGAINKIYIGKNVARIPNYEENISFIKEVCKKDNIEMEYM